MKLSNVVLIIGLTAVAAIFVSFARAETEVTDYGRACVPAYSAAEEVTATTGASDASSALNPATLYYIKCDTEAYFRTCASTTCTAAAGDFKLPADTILPFLTSSKRFGSANTVGAIAAKSVAVSGSCWLLECR